jgi:DNA-binding transcriptional MerR regulator
MEISMETALPLIPAKRYFTIGEVSELCGVKPYVLRYWEQEFTQLKPMKRRGNRRYYQHHEVLLIRRIRELLYDQGFTIVGARNRLVDAAAAGRPDAASGDASGAALDAAEAGGEFDSTTRRGAAGPLAVAPASTPTPATPPTSMLIGSARLRAELLSIRELLQA